MKKISEKDVLWPAIKIILSKKECTMSDIIANIENEMVFSSEDLAPLLNRKDKKYSQIIRNLSSHFENGNKFSEYVQRRFQPDTKDYLYSIKKEKIQQILSKFNHKYEFEINDYEDDLKVLTNSEPEYTNEEIKLRDERNPNINPDSGKNKRFYTDSRLSKTVIIRANSRCELSSLSAYNHFTFSTPTGMKYLEAHHIIPMKYQKHFIPFNLDRTDNIIALCPTCHRCIHHGNLNDKLPLLKFIYDTKFNKIKDLNKKFDILFEDLVNNYYL
jgi:predicted HNH restriction endonuclease